MHEPTAAEVTAAVQKHGVQQAETTLRVASEWDTWADRLDALILEMPFKMHPSYMDEFMETSSINPGTDLIDRDALISQLHGVRMHADAMAMALTRTARRVDEQTFHTVRLLSEQEPAH